MRRLVSMRSSMKVSANSWALRTKVRSPLRNRFLANCWVMVEPPTILGGLPVARESARSSALEFLAQAFSTASQSTPSWLAKPSSSEAMTARLRLSEIWL